VLAARKRLERLVLGTLFLACTGIFVAVIVFLVLKR
jgi:hypothetical protein